jgi:UDP-N-acetylglucosamine 1-carboxyvinyltransferase
MNQESLLIQGLDGKKELQGEITVGGAKNAALPLMAAWPLYDGAIAFDNVPVIADVSRLSELIERLGGRISRTNNSLKIEGEIKGVEFDRVLSKRMRASVIMTGSVLARQGFVRFPYPGGCVIGKRPIDLFLKSFEKMGSVVREVGEYYEVQAPPGGLHGAEIFMKVQSVTATEAVMLAATLARGRTVIKNAAIEPEIVSLAEFLRLGGSKISGAGTTVIEIEGVRRLVPPRDAFRVIPDRIETGSFLILGALAAKELRINACLPDHLEIVIEELRQAGVSIERGSDYVVVRGENAGRLFKPFDFKTHEYPGFPTDLQAPAVVFLTQSDGESHVFESIFDGRLAYTEDLVRMGAVIELMDTHRALVRGPAKLSGRELYGPDIRAGLAFVIAAAIAAGESLIHNAYFIDRGYEKIEERLRGIGLDIKRVMD